MRKRNKVHQLHRPKAHRQALLRNMVKSFFFHEQIESTVSKTKALQATAEKLITRAKANLSDEADQARKIHNIRLVERVIKDREILHKLFDDITPRYKERQGGYTRIIKLGRRASDNSEMAIIQLVEKKELVQIKEERKLKRAEKAKKSKPVKKAEPKKEKADKKK